jgi:hypothetical protein
VYTYEAIQLVGILAWPAVAVVALLVIRPHLHQLLSGAKVKFSVAGQSIETTLPEVKAILEEQAGEPLSPEQVKYLNALYREGAKQYPEGVDAHEDREFLRPLRNAGLVLTIPRNAFLRDAKAIELSALGRLFLRASVPATDTTGSRKRSR